MAILSSSDAAGFNTTSSLSCASADAPRELPVLNHLNQLDAERICAELYATVDGCMTSSDDSLSSFVSYTHGRPPSHLPVYRPPT